MRNARIIAASLLLGVAANASAQTSLNGQTKAITTAAPFLSVCPDSRAGGMGEVGVSNTVDANAMHWNVGGLAFLKGQAGASLTYTPWLRALGLNDINLAYLSGYVNTNKSGVIGGSLRFFSLGQIQWTDQNANVTGKGNPNEVAVDLGYALKITENLSAGVALRFFNSNLTTAGNVQTQTRPINSGAGDVGFQYRKGFKVNTPQGKRRLDLGAGVAVSNIGPKVSYTRNRADRDFIPTNLRVGYSLKYSVDDYNSFAFINDFNKLMVPSEGGASDKSFLQGMFGSFSDAKGGFSEEISEWTMQFGAEYSYRDLLFVRGGYFYEDPQKGNRTFVNVGLGIKYNALSVDFAYLAPLAQSHPLQNTLRFGIGVDLASAGNQ